MTWRLSKIDDTNTTSIRRIAGDLKDDFLVAGQNGRYPRFGVIYDDYGGGAPCWRLTALGVVAGTFDLD
jgi:hypothetical protein